MKCRHLWKLKNKGYIGKTDYGEPEEYSCGTMTMSGYVEVYYCQKCLIEKVKK